MEDLLQQEITGAPVTVAIAGAEHELAYPMHAVILYKQKTGDSLFVMDNFKKIDLQEDPERWLTCLWAGLHKRDAKGEWKSPLAFGDLQEKIDFSNAADVSVAMAKALIRSMPKPRNGNASPNAAAPEIPTLEGPPAPPHPTLTSTESIGSTPEPVAVLDSVAQSS